MREDATVILRFRQSQTQFLNKEQEKPRRIIKLLGVYSQGKCPKTVSQHTGFSQSVRSNSLRSGWGHTGRQTCTKSRVVEGGFKAAKWGKNKPKTKKKLSGFLTFLVKILSDFTELPIA